MNPNANLNFNPRFSGAKGDENESLVKYVAELKAILDRVSRERDDALLEAEQVKVTVRVRGRGRGRVRARGRVRC